MENEGESYEDFEEQLVQRTAERVLGLLEGEFRRRVRAFFVRKIMSGAWTFVISVGAWETVKALKLPHWAKDVLMNLMGG